MTKHREWAALREAKCVAVDGVEYDLSHLDYTEIIVEIPATEGKPAVNFNLGVSYSAHCVSIGPKQGQGFDFAAIGEDKLIIDERGVHRCFDITRYEFSRILPDLLLTLEDRVCFFTGHENYLTIEAQMLGLKTDNPYEIYFSLRKESKGYLRMYVESAYLRDDDYMDRRPQNFKKREKVKGRVLLLNTLRGTPTKRPPR